MSIAHYSRSKLMLKKQGYSVWKVEQPWNRFTKVRRDLYNVIDAIAIDGKQAILGVQVTNGDKCHAHVLKALANEYLPLWLASGGRFEIHAWRKVNDYGRKRLKWEPRIIALYWDTKTKEVKVNQKTEAL